MAKLASRWRRMLSDATFLYLLPLLVAVLPWRWGFALLRRIARLDAVFADVVEAAWREARSAFPDLDRDAFRHRHRLMLLVDRCDSSLTWLRSARWWQRQIEVSGDPLAAMRPGLFLSMHWGSGSWVWLFLKAQGMPAWVLGRRAEVTDVGRSWLTRGYVAWRTWVAMRSGCRGMIYVGGSSARVLAAFRDEEMVLGMLDLPAAAGRRRVAVPLLGRRAHFASGLMALAVEAGAPVTVASFGFDTRTGRRQLFLEVLPAGLDVEDSMQRYAAHLARRIEADPALWFVWPNAPAYFQQADSGDDPPTPGPTGG